MRGHSRSSAASFRRTRDAAIAAPSLRATRDGGRARPARSGPRTAALGWPYPSCPDRRDGGVRARRPGESRVPGANAAGPRHVRTSGASVRVLHLRHAPLHEWGHRSEGHGERRLAQGGAAARRHGPHVRPPGNGPDRGSLSGAGPLRPSVRGRPEPRWGGPGARERDMDRTGSRADVRDRPLRPSRRDPRRNGPPLALLDRRTVGVAQPAGSAFATVIVTVFVWKSGTPPDGV